MAKGLDSARLLQQTEAIDRLNATLSGITILKGIEVDILEDGNLDCRMRCSAGWIWWSARCTAASTSRTAGRPSAS